MAEIHRKKHKKDLNDPDTHDGMITHLEPEILESKVRWALGSINMNKLVEVMEFQLSYFESWKMMLWKCCTQYASKFGKHSSAHRTGKSQFSFQSQRRVMPKNAQTTAQLHSSHTLTSSVQLLSCVRLFSTPWITAHQASLSITNSRSSPRLTSIESVMPSSHLILCRPLLLLPPIPPSIRVFSNESVLCIRWPKYWSFSFNISLPTNSQDRFPLGWTGWISW